MARIAKRVQPTLRKQGGAAILVVVGIAALGLIVIGGLYLMYRRIIGLTGQAVTSVRVVEGGLTAPRPFPPTVSGSIALEYRVAGRDGTQTGGSPAVVTGPATPEPGAEVTFILARGDASVNGQTSMTVSTDSQGVARATLTAVRNGYDTLSVRIRVGRTQTDDAEVFQFETAAP